MLIEDFSEIFECECGVILSNSLFQRVSEEGSPNLLKGVWEYEWKAVCPVCKEEHFKWE